MISDISPQAQDSSSSKPLTVVSSRSEPVLELGKKIVDELGPDQSVDTLALWMAHHIAELIQAADTAKTEDRPAAMTVCASAILDLWKQRQMLPNGRRPFEDLEPILSALETLDSGDGERRYIRAVWQTVDEKEEGEETRKWLDVADGLDYSARILIRYFLTCAAQSALDKSKNWVALAEAAGFDSS